MTRCFCPACGKPLVRTKNLHRSTPLASDLSEHWKCENGSCRVGGTVFKVHNPFRGVDSKPSQDFWSVSWIK
jgi:hypothetical protein